MLGVWSIPSGISVRASHPDQQGEQILHSFVPLTAAAIRAEQRLLLRPVSRHQRRLWPCVNTATSWAPAATVQAHVSLIRGRGEARRSMAAAFIFLAFLGICSTCRSRLFIFLMAEDVGSSDLPDGNTLGVFPLQPPPELTPHRSG